MSVKSLGTYRTQNCCMFTKNVQMPQTKLAFPNVCSIIATKAREKVKILPEHQRKCTIFWYFPQIFSFRRVKDTIFRLTSRLSRSDWQVQRKQMSLPDMFDSSGGPPGKYCHTGTGPSAHTYHNPSGLKTIKFRQWKYSKVIKEFRLLLRKATMPRQCWSWSRLCHHTTDEFSDFFLDFYYSSLIF